MAFLLSGSLLAATPLSASDGTTELGLRQMAVPFVANQGQADSRVAFSASTFAGTVFVTRDGRIVYALPTREAPAWSLTETFVGQSSRPTGQDRSEARVSSFLGADPSRWRSDLPTFDSVRLGELWKGIEVSLVARGGEVEKLFTVAPGASTSKIRVQVAGASLLRVDRRGRLVATTGRGEVLFSAPVAYQSRDGEHAPVAVTYVAHGTEYGFRLGPYDPSLPVVIDPILQSTYLGGTVLDAINAMTIHPVSGEVYVVGQTTSTDFPGTTGGAQPASGGGSADAFVARFNAALTSLLQATYLGGSAFDHAVAVAVHPTSGDVYVSGQTQSTNIPMTSGGTQPANGGVSDGFIARLNATLTSLIQATYLGGNDQESGGGANLAIHPISGEIYTAATTDSANFPGVAGGAQSSIGGFSDGYIARLNASLTGPVLQATFLGGSHVDFIGSIVFDSAGGVYAVGQTRSTNFPMTAGGARPNFTPGGFFDYDGFVSRFNTALTSLVQSTYYGGSGSDTGPALAIHATSGDVYIAGSTSSTDLPGTSGGAQPFFAGLNDAYVARVNSTLTAILQATYRGGSGFDITAALILHPTSGDVYIAGQTSSGDFPGTAGGAQAIFAGGDDFFVSRLNTSLTAPLNPSTFLGGSGGDFGTVLRLHPASGEIYVGGYSTSTNFPATSGGAQAAYAGGPTDSVLARLTADLTAAGGGYFTVTPCRVIDTRDPVGPYGGPALAAGASRDVVFAGRCGIPVTARALAFNLTITGPTDQGHLRVFPTGAILPLISMMNYRAGQTRANNGVSTLGPSGDLTIFSGQATGTVHFIVDVVGYFQ